MTQSPLKFLHSESNLIKLKLEDFRKISTEDLIESLKPENEGALKTKSDGNKPQDYNFLKWLH